MVGRLALNQEGAGSTPASAVTWHDETVPHAA